RVVLPPALVRNLKLAPRENRPGRNWESGAPQLAEPSLEFENSGALNVEPAPSPNTTAVPVVANDGGSLGDESSVTLLRRLMGQIDAPETQSVQFRSSMSSILDAAPSPAAPHVGSSIAPSTNELIELIIEAIEDRVIDELERRGRRYNPGVF